MAISISTGLDAALRTAGIPIAGVSIGNPADRQTWVVQFLPEATAPQQTQAAQIVAAFDVASLATVAADARWAADDSPLLEAVLEHLSTMVAEIQATGTIQKGLWRTRIRATLRTLYRVKG